MPIHAGHVDVRDEDRNALMRRQLFEGIRPAGCAEHLTTEVVKHVGKHFEYVGVVVYNEHKMRHPQASERPHFSQRKLSSCVPATYGPSEACLTGCCGAVNRTSG